MKIEIEFKDQKELERYIKSLYNIHELWNPQTIEQEMDSYNLFDLCDKLEETIQ